MGVEGVWVEGADGRDHGGRGGEGRHVVAKGGQVRAGRRTRGVWEEWRGVGRVARGNAPVRVDSLIAIEPCSSSTSAGTRVVTAP